MELLRFLFYRDFSRWKPRNVSSGGAGAPAPPGSHTGSTGWVRLEGPRCSSAPASLLEQGPDGTHGTVCTEGAPHAL